MYENDSGVERMYVGQTEDLRRTFVSHIAGSKGNQELRRGMQQHTTFFRYWLCEVERRRLEIVYALADIHFYECGWEQSGNSVDCVRLTEIE
jgi:hypothetical protein